MYRVGAIAVHDGRLLVEHNLRHRFCFVPGGHVEYGESALTALDREVLEEAGEGAEIGRLVLISDNLFELDGVRYQEVVLYFLIEFTPGSGILERRGTFDGNEPRMVFEWVPLDDLGEVNLQPRFLRELVRDVPSAPHYVQHSSLEPT